jgi:hypothetical protein
MGSGLLMTRRRRTTRPTGPQAVAARLPDELCSFDGWYYPNGLSDYMRELSRFLVDGQRLAPVMNAAGLSAADWFRHMLSDDEGSAGRHHRSDGADPELCQAESRGG